MKIFKSYFFASFIIFILLISSLWKGYAMAENRKTVIKVQIKPLLFEDNQKIELKEQARQDVKVNLKYNDIENMEVAQRLRDAANKQVKADGYEKFNINFLINDICQNIKKNLPRYSILVVENTPDLTIGISVSGTGINSLYGPRLIADTVVYNGFTNEKVVFSGEFKQNYKFPFGSIKTPEQIGVILAKRISKEIKKLQNSK